MAVGTASLVEQAIYFAIGFLVALLGAIIALPTISRRATRLAEARARLQAPSTEKQAVAAADALRARHAVHEVQLAQKLALAESAPLALRVDVGRLSAQIIALKSEASERESVLFDKQSEIEKLEWNVQSLQAGLAAAQGVIFDASAQRDRARASEGFALARQHQLEAAANYDRAQIATLMARAENLEARLQETIQAAAAAAAESEGTHHKLATSLAEQASLALRHEGRLQDVTRRHERLMEAATHEKAVLESARRHMAELEVALAGSERAREESLLENGRQLQHLGERETALQIAEARIRDLEARLASVADARANEESSSAPEQQNASTHGFPRSALAARKAGPRETDALRGMDSAQTVLPPSESDAALRASVKRLGREVSRLYSAIMVAERAEREPGELAAGDPEPGAAAKVEQRRAARSNASER